MLRGMRKTLLVGLALLLSAPAAAAAPDGFRLSAPLTARSVKVGGNPAVTVNCALSSRAWADTAGSTDAANAAGRTNMTTREIELPPSRCAPLERWLKGKTVDMELFAYALFTLAHEVAHAAVGERDELAAECYATRRFNATARAFGVKRNATLRRLRDQAPLVSPSFC